MNERQVGVLGASSLVGVCLLPLLLRTGWRVLAFSRSQAQQVFETFEKAQEPTSGSIAPSDGTGKGDESIPYWICLAPIWVLSDYFDMLSLKGARRVVALSSTSRFTKDCSSDPREQRVARRLAEAEAGFVQWAEQGGVEWIILRPTLIYGRGQDKNIIEIARFIRRFKFFPLLGEANGLRQPVHAEDVAAACANALQTMETIGHAYNLSGGEVLTYREMVRRVFVALGRRPRMVTVPPFLFRSAVRCLRLLPRYRLWSSAMAERMNQNLVFDHTDAVRDLKFSPRMFDLDVKEVEEVMLKQV